MLLSLPLDIFIIVFSELPQSDLDNFALASSHCSRVARYLNSVPKSRFLFSRGVNYKLREGAAVCLAPSRTSKIDDILSWFRGEKQRRLLSFVVYGGFQASARGFSLGYVSELNSKFQSRYESGHDRAFHEMVAHNGKLYSFFGEGGYFNTCKSSILSRPLPLSYQDFHPIANCNLAREKFSLVVHNGKAIIFGGEIADAVYDDIWSFDFETERLTEIIAENEGPNRSDHAAVVYDGKMYVIGGVFLTDDEAVQSTIKRVQVWSFDFETKLWSTLECRGQAPPEGRTRALLWKQRVLVSVFGKPGIWTLELETCNWRRYETNIDKIVSLHLNLDFLIAVATDGVHYLRLW